MNRNIMLASLLILFISGCASTQNYRSISESDIPNYHEKISDLSAGRYESYWVQPANKRVICQLLMEGYSYDGQSLPRLEPNQLTWDGECKEGKTHGLGKMVVNSGSVDWYEIAYHNLGITDRHYYRGIIGDRNIQYGSYVRIDGKSEKLAQVQSVLSSNGEIEFSYAFVEIDSKNGTSQGVINRKYTDGTGKYTGIVGNKLFFGAREFYDANNQPNGAFLGYANLTTDKPDSYVILKNNTGIWHQYYEHGNLKDNIILPKSYIDALMKIYEQAADSARTAVIAGQLALAMKKKYDELHSEYAHNQSNIIKMNKSGGVYEIPVELNDVLKIAFILDSGASEVLISPDVALTLYRTGTIQESHFLQGKTYKFANGSSAKSNRFILQSITIGNKKLTKIPCAISDSISAPMLLGQSALEKLGKFSIDYNKGILVFD